jgi:hypothetical protein
MIVKNPHEPGSAPADAHAPKRFGKLADPPTFWQHVGSERMCLA